MHPLLAAGLANTSSAIETARAAKARPRQGTPSPMGADGRGSAKARTPPTSRARRTS